MVREDHLARLRQGVDHWNHWRRSNPEIIVDLSEADLSEASLSEIDLRAANLDGVNLSRARSKWGGVEWFKSACGKPESS
ncbi:pentapeptide repeat-containing protein [Kovacikia minuta]|uniref:pentapeptide repeat-containing protein n=1 Tax=Kovacikia minuta TaxID=2931930 RepID=UPI0028F40ADD|nr:pentapeptide repeat-containing protein [Kovacikia minuta]